MWLWALLFSCKQFIIVSPKNGVFYQSSPWIPVSFWFGDRVGAPTSIDIQLNGEEWQDPLSLLRKRWSGKGGGYDYLGYLDLHSLENGEHQMTAIAQLSRNKILKQRSVFLIDRPAGEINFNVFDDQGIPIDARIVIYADGEPYNLAAPNSSEIDPSERDKVISTVMTTMGFAKLYLPPNEYEILIYRGFRDSIHVENLIVEEDSSVEVNATLERIVSTSGWSTADFHVHTANSADAFIPNYIRYQSVLSTDLDSVIITEHNEINDPESDLNVLRGDRPGAFFIPGNEATVGFYNASGEFKSKGHANAFPLALADFAPIPPNTPSTVAELWDNYRNRQVENPYNEETQDVLLQLNHPRGIQFFSDRNEISAHPLFNFYGFNPNQPIDSDKNQWIIEEEPGTGTRAIDFDAMEIINRFSWGLFKRVRSDWFSFLNQGFHITGTGNSDSHSLEVEQIGFPLNFIPCPVNSTNRDDFDMDCLIQSVQEGKLMVSNGPILDIEVTSGDQTVGMGGMISVVENALTTATVTLQAVAWVPVEEIRLTINGVVVEQINVSNWVRNESGVLMTQFTFDLPSEKDSWVIIEAGRDLARSLEADPTNSLREEYGHYAKIAVGHVPIAFTNPIYIDADNDQVWTPPGL